MKAFWELAARHWPLSLPRRRLEATLGAEQVEILLASRILTEGALVDGDTVPCSSCRWPARLVLEGTEMLAICSAADGCAHERFGADPSRVFLDPSAFARELAGAVGLNGSPGAPGPVLGLGSRSFGEDVVAFDLVANPARSGLLDALYRHARQGPPHRVVLVPSGRSLPADLPTEVAGSRLAWAGLDDIVVLGERFSVEMRPVLRRLGLREPNLAPPFAGLLLTAAGASWRGASLPVEGAPLALRLLRALAHAPGAYVSRRELWRALYPAEHAPSGRVTPGVNPDDLDDRLRAVVGKVRSAFRALGNAPGLPDDVIENRRGDDKVGGYRLALPAELVRVE